MNSALPTICWLTTCGLVYVAWDIVSLERLRDPRSTYLLRDYLLQKHIWATFGILNLLGAIAWLVITN